MGPLIYAALALMAAVIFVALRYADGGVRPSGRSMPKPSTRQLAKPPSGLKRPRAF